MGDAQTDFDANWKRYETWGDRNSYPHYHAGWAMAGNTPFRYFKQSVHRGGIQDALIVHWPEGIEGKNEIRDQYHHISDIAPTLLDVIGLDVPDEIDGIEQRPMDGVSMRYSFNDADAPNAKKVQYYEMFGNRSVWADGWKAVTLHGDRMPWELNSTAPFDGDKWELYHVATDFSGSKDLAAEHPAKLAELQQLFDEQAEKYNVYPLYDDMIARISKQQDRLFINDEKVGEVDMPQTHNATFSLSEPFDVGVDNGTPVSTLYQDHFPFEGGVLDKVTFRLLD